MKNSGWFEVPSLSPAVHLHFWHVLEGGDIAPCWHMLEHMPCMHKPPGFNPQQQQKWGQGAHFSPGSEVAGSSQS